MNRTLTAMVALALMGVHATAQTVEIKGRVVDFDGNPVPGAEVASSWDADERGTAVPSRPAKTGADGRFTIKYRRDFDEALLALDAAHKSGGVGVVSAERADETLEIRLVPLVRVRGTFTSSDLGVAPAWTQVFINSLPGNYSFIQFQSKTPEFLIFLPPGDYKLTVNAPDVQMIPRDVTAKADVELGTVDLPASIIAKHRGKTPPPWVVADARNTKKDVTLADFKGKWVLVDFWGQWCGPCIGRMPKLMDFYEEHKAHRDKFEIVAFHDATARDFADMDAKLATAKAKFWDGRDIPFPTLLDAPDKPESDITRGDGKTIRGYGIESFPTMLLIDPEGKLVRQIGDLEELEEKLPALPMAYRIRRGLDRDVLIDFDTIPLDKAIETLSSVSYLPIRLDPDALKAAGIAADTPIPLTITGGVSLRSALDLVLRPCGLVATPGEDGLVARPRRDAGEVDLSPPQKTCAARIEGKLGNKVSYDFRGATLAEVAKFFENLTGENFVLDPSGRKAGAIDSKTVATGLSKDVPLREALATLLKPLALSVVIEDEVVVLAKP